MSETKPVLKTLDHVIIAVRDLGAACAQYERLLGLSASWTAHHPEIGTANTLFRLDNTYLELLAPDGEGPLGEMLQDWIDVRGEGLLGLAFGTEDAHTCHAAFAERGLRPGDVDEGQGQDVDTRAIRQWRRITLPIDRTRGVLLFAIEHLSPVEALPRAATVGDEAASVYALDHAVVQTRDAEAARHLYGDELGLRLALDKTFADWGTRLMFFRVGGVTIEVASMLQPAGDGEGAAAAGAMAGATDADASGPTPDEDRLWGLSYRVGNADAARARIAAAGFDVSEVRPGRRPNTRVFSVRNKTCGIPTLMLEVTPAQ
ncbi:MAG TPA: VOC family protein [Candidatus Limnocylindrales bacterium]|nr:VOC family protein [Candidatus Limnocylindrales bacterium]